MQAQQWLEKCYGDSAPLKTTICRWYAEFKRGRADTEDAERCGRPNEVVTPETIKNVHQIVFENRKLKLHDRIEENRELSVPRRSQELGLSRMTTWRI